VWQDDSVEVMFDAKLTINDFKTTPIMMMPLMARMHFTANGGGGTHDSLQQTSGQRVLRFAATSRRNKVIIV